MEQSISKYAKHYLSLLSVLDGLDEDKDEFLIDPITDALDILWYKRMSKEDIIHVKLIIGSEDDEDDEDEDEDDENDDTVEEILETVEEYIKECNKNEIKYYSI